MALTIKQILNEVDNMIPGETDYRVYILPAENLCAYAKRVLGRKGGRSERWAKKDFIEIQRSTGLILSQDQLRIKRQAYQEASETGERVAVACSYHDFDGGAQ